MCSSSIESVSKSHGPLESLWCFAQWKLIRRLSSNGPSDGILCIKIYSAGRSLSWIQDGDSLQIGWLSILRSLSFKVSQLASGDKPFHAI
mmetsp:Transcript_3731/g.11119  ORF Transcript_3731/g.11119 Transcript_3731/m.11119 type:complete len:90 (+) Transcript_3731:33-302(+)